MTGWQSVPVIVATNVHAPVKMPHGDPMPWQSEEPRP